MRKVKKAVMGLGAFRGRTDLTYRESMLKSYSAAQYMRLQDSSGTTVADSSGNNRTGTYFATSVPNMLAKLAGPLGGLTAQFDPANLARVDNFSASLAGAINMNAMSFVLAIKVSAGAIWTDATSRYIMLLRSSTTANQLFIQRTTTNNTFIVRRTANNVSKTHTINNFSLTEWFVIGFDVSEAGSYQRLYINGVPYGADLVPDAWAGGALTMAQLGPIVANYWSGGLAEWAVFPAPIGQQAHAKIAASYFPGVIGYPDTSDLNHILLTGQSLSNGTNGGVALSTTPPYRDNYKMTARPQSYWLEPLREVENISYPNLESPATALGTELRALGGYRMLITRNGQDGQAYTALKKGTQNYTDGITQATRAYAMAGSKHKMTGVSVIHGETDGANNVTAAVYAGYLVEWQNDYQTDINAATAHVGTLPMLLCQLSSQAATVTNTLKQVSLGQYNACKANPTKLFLAGPKYQLNYADTDHLTNSSYRWLGEYHAKAWRSIMETGSWTPLWPTAVSRINNEIRITMNVPAGPLVFDTVNVPAIASYGFEYTDDGTPPAISNVAIDGNDVVITLASTPVGANKKIRYAYTTKVAGGVGPKGNLRDSDATPSYYGNNLYNWCVHFEETVP